MADVLSQQEIDHLLSGMYSGSIQVDDVLHTELGKREVSSYDFRRPNRLSKTQLRTLQAVHEAFAETFGYFLVSKLQTVVSVTVTSADQLFYSEFILSVANPSCLYVFDIEGTDGKGIMEISPQLAFSVIERLLGGSSDVPKKSRAITNIEQAVIRGIIERAFADLTTSWRSLSDNIAFKFSRLETEADFVQVAPGSEIVLVVSFDVNIGTNSYLMNLCFPTFALEEVIAQLSKRQLKTDVKITLERIRENEEMVRKQVSTTMLPVWVELGKASISIRELMNLKLGDIVKLNTRIDQEIQLIISGKRKLAARPGVVDKRRAARVTRVLTEDDIIDD